MRKVWIATALYVVVFAILETYRWRVWSFGSDTGTFTQAILAAGKGFVDGPEGGSHYLYHFSPILAAFYPLVALTGSPLALQIAQVVLVALVAPLLYSLCMPYMEERVAWRLALLALLYPPLAAVAFGEFHELGLFPVLAIGLVWAADRGKWLLFALFGAACLMTREDVGLELAVVGAELAALSLLRRMRSERRGLLFGEPREPLATAAAFGLLAIFGALVPSLYYHTVLATYGRWPHGHFYDYSFASGPLGVLAALVTQPGAAFPALLQLGRLTYMLEALAPLAILPLRSAWTFAALPGFAIVLLAREQSVWRMGNHYAALWIPWLLIATAAALVRIEYRQGAGAARGWSNAAIALSVIVLAAFDPMHPSHYLSAAYPDIASARAALECVPKDATVSTHDEWFAEIAAQYPNATVQAGNGLQYLVYADDFPNDRFRRLILPALTADVASGRYRVVCTFGRVKAYRAAR